MTFQKSAARVKNVLRRMIRKTDVQKKTDVENRYPIASALMVGAYKLSYKTGKAALKVFGMIRAAARSVWNVAISEGFGKASDFIRRASEFKQSRQGRGDVSLARAVAALWRSAAGAFRTTLRIFLRQGPIDGFRWIFTSLSGALKTSWAKRRKYLNYAAPVLGVLVLAATVYVWSHLCFALAVTYNNRFVGLIRNENVFRNAAYEIETNVSNASGQNYHFTAEPEFKLVIAEKSQLSTQDELYDHIVLASADDVVSGYGLYVDHRLIGVSQDGQQIEAMLNSFLLPYEKNTDAQKVEFNQDVEVKRGVYPSSVVKSVLDMRGMLTSQVEGKRNYTAQKGDSPIKVAAMFHLSLNQLYAMNPSLSTDQMYQGQAVIVKSSRQFLSVRLIKNIVYIQQIPYATQKIPTNRLYQGEAQLKTKGQNGSVQVVAAVSYEGSNPAGRTILSTTWLQRPVKQQVYVGVKPKPYSDSSDGNVGLSASGSRTAGGIIGLAESFIGTRYVFGGSAPGGFDCSGFTMYVYSRYGISLAHSALFQSGEGRSVGRSGLKVGDLVFFDTDGGHNSINHVGMYIGGGRFIQASSRNPNAITISSLNERYYANAYMTARRILN